VKRVVAACLVGLALAGCASSSPPVRPAVARADKARAGGAVGMATAAPVAAAARRPVLRLGVLAEPAAGIALADLRDGFFQAELALGTVLTAVPYGSASAEAAALAAGRLDAAYISPVGAIEAWQATRGGVRIIAGAAVTGPDTTAVLAVTTRLLASSPAAVRSLLRGHIQAEDLIATDLTAAQPLVQAELASLGVRLSRRQLTAALARIRFTDNPVPASVAAQARHATADGLISPVTGLGGIYQLGPLNTLLRSAGQVPVTG
jgi:NitT/TauT family transport system substrate-binding protein